MSNPTSSFGWQMPTASDLVTDLPADFETFGQAVDTTLADLKGGTTGQVLSKASNTDMDFTWVAQDDSNAIQNAIVDAKGDLIAATAADTPARLAVGTDGQVLTADSTASTGLAWATPSGGSNQFFAGKNKIINGDFYINQRGFTSNTTHASFNFDRWFQGNGGGTYTVTPQTFTPGTAPVSGYEGKNYLQAITASQSGTSDYGSIQQSIESVRTFAGQTVTVSFWAKANTGTPKFGLSVQQSFGSGGSPSAAVRTAGNATVTLSTSWARYSITVSVPSISGKTLGTSENDKLILQLWQSLGSDFTTGFPSGIGLQNFTLSLWGVQIEAGSTATDFQTATGTFQGELALCQRYYTRLANVGSATEYWFGSGYAGSSTQAQCILPLTTTMRSSTITLDYSGVRLQDYGAGYAISALIYVSSARNNIVVGATSTGLTSNRPLAIDTNTTGYIGISAEL